jgi:threonine/homoserine/homoserine lactone efflux protein
MNLGFDFTLDLWLVIAVFAIKFILVALWIAKPNPYRLTFAIRKFKAYVRTSPNAARWISFIEFILCAVVFMGIGVLLAYRG